MLKHRRKTAPAVSLSPCPASSGLQSRMSVGARLRRGCLRWSTALLLGIAACCGCGSASAESASSADVVSSASSAPLLSSWSESDDSRPVLTVALLDTLINPYDTFYLRQTIRHLSEVLPAYRWRTISISAAEAESDIARAKPDFLFAPSGFAASSALTQSPAAFRIATRRNKTADRAEASVGAVFVVREKDGLRTLQDLRGKRAGTGIPMAVEGWLAAAGEIVDAGEDPESFFSKVNFRNNAYPDVIASLLAGKIDVAILPSCLLETLEAAKLVDTEGLAVVNAKSNGLACAHSTALYPDVSFLALSTAPETAVRDATIAILSQKSSFREFEWLTNVPLGSVQTLFRKLEVGPYAYLRDMSPKALFLRWKTEIFIALLLLGFLLVNEVRLRVLVRRRTEDLRRSVEERNRMAEEAEAVRKRLAGFERRSIVQQMSGMITHEINAPIGAIRTYAAVLRMSSPAIASDAASPSAKALEGIEHEAVRIADIVGRVRAYAKRANNAHVPCRLNEVVEKSVMALRAELPSVNALRLDVRLPDSPVTVSGDPLELELLVLNLLRNAASAVRRSEDAASLSSPRSRVRPTKPNVRLVLASEPDRGRCRITIENAVHVTPEDIEKLNSVTAGLLQDQSDRRGEGLGLGLSICRGIADNHCASLRFEAAGLGVRATVEMDLFRDDDSTGKSTENSSDSKETEGRASRNLE